MKNRYMKLYSSTRTPLEVHKKKLADWLERGTMSSKEYNKRMAAIKEVQRLKLIELI